MIALTDEIVEEGFPADRVRTVESPEEAAALLATTLAPGDVVLFKASRGVGLERAVKRLMGRSSRDGR